MTEPDPLSEALRSVRLTGAIFLDAELGMPWGFASPPTSATAHLLAPTAEHLVLFHLLVEGQAMVRIPGSDSVPLEAGDIVVLSRGDAHELWNGSVRQLTYGSSPASRPGLGRWQGWRSKPASRAACSRHASLICSRRRRSPTSDAGEFNSPRGFSRPPMTACSRLP